MSLTKEDIRAVLSGSASQEVQTRFCAELSDPMSEASQAIQGFEDWARLAFGSSALTVAEQLPEHQPAPKLLRRAAFNSAAHVKARPVPTIDDLIAILRGTATDPVRTAVKAALDDLASPLHRALRNAIDKDKRAD